MTDRQAGAGEAPSLDAICDRLKEIVGPGGWLAGADTGRYTQDPRGRITASAKLVLRPKETNAVADILRTCNSAGIGVVPYGGGTGGAIGHMDPRGGAPIVLSLERMNKIRSVCAEDNAIVAEAGVTLAEIRMAAAQAARCFGLSLASEGSCTIGGNLSSNAGGKQTIRYGNARDLCLGIEAVMADGSILNGLSPLRKDNTGYDLRHLLIGSEGTLGVITACSLKLDAKPQEECTAMCPVASPQSALDLLHHLRGSLGEVISAFELMSATGMTLALKHFPELRNPFDTPHDWYVLAEIAGPEGIRKALERGLAEALEKELIQDAVLSGSERQSQALWALRENAFEYNKREGVLYSSDTCVPLSRIRQFVETTQRNLRALDPGLRINVYGHVGDGNIHVNVFPPDAGGHNSITSAAVAEVIYEATHGCGGSISAEHGIGRAKKTTLLRYGDPTKLSVMRGIKKAIDPNGIMNPGALL
ncbi:FAD-binding oxidoreductase [Nitratireductor sp. XY-223]|uniref:FAD-binding oxidoreductase n=1 Tax=Nitratireductor sp. XY-223 TaxID=2561926 RepID=UPI001981EC8D|nr:FAD-binding oxidoreductase [Nitratireductor sp. XY-223]